MNSLSFLLQHCFNCYNDGSYSSIYRGQVTDDSIYFWYVNYCCFESFFLKNFSIDTVKLWRTNISIHIKRANMFSYFCLQVGVHHYLFENFSIGKFLISPKNSIALHAQFVQSLVNSASYMIFEQTWADHNFIFPFQP